MFFGLVATLMYRTVSPPKSLLFTRTGKSANRIFCAKIASLGKTQDNTEMNLYFIDS